MNEQNDKSYDRLEGMLRQWGAQQAADEAASELFAAPKAAKRQRGPVLLRWVPAAAAAGLLLAAGAVFMLARIQRQADIAADRGGSGDTRGPAVPTTSPAIADLSRQLAESQRDAVDARNALSDVLADKAARDQQIKDLQRDLDKLKVSHLDIAVLMDGWKTERRKIADERKQWALKEEKLKSRVETAELTVAAVNVELQQVRKDLAVAKAAAVSAAENLTELKRVKARLAAAVDELRRQQDTFRQANEQRTKAREELASLKARHQAALDQIRSVYLAACAPGKTGLEALRETVRRRDLLGRCTALQRKARTDADKKLLARAEVALTRLCLLDISDSIAVQGFVKRLAAGGLIASLDAALGPLAADARTQDWLFETKLILTGVQRVL